MRPGRARGVVARASDRAADSRARDPAPALLRRADPAGDRRPGRHLADARLASDPKIAGPDARDPRADRLKADGPPESGPTTGEVTRVVPVNGKTGILDDAGRDYPWPGGSNTNVYLAR